MPMLDQLAPEQVRILYNAPFAAAAYVGLASGSMVDFVSEMAAAGRFIAGGARPGQFGVLVDAITALIQTLPPAERKQWEMSFASHDTGAMREQARSVVAAAAQVVQPLPGADGYCHWLMAAARAAALAATGGFFRAGARQEIDVYEHAAIEELARILLGLRR